MSYQYPDRQILWPDGSSVPAELASMLLDGLQPGFEIQSGEFAWNSSNWLVMTLRLSVLRPRQKPRVWEISFSCPAQDATAILADASSAEREWFSLRIRTHIAEWLNGVPSIIESARMIT